MKGSVKGSRAWASAPLLLPPNGKPFPKGEPLPKGEGVSDHSAAAPSDSSSILSTSSAGFPGQCRKVRRSIWQRRRPSSSVAQRRSTEVE